MKLDPSVYELYDFKPQKSELKKVEIILATIESIAKIGFDKTSYSSIAEIMGLKKSNVAYYFPCKEDLIRDAVSHLVRCQQQMSIKYVGEAKNDKEMLFKYIEASFDWAAKYPEQLSAFILFRYIATYNPEYRDLHTKIRVGGAERIRHLITEKYGKKMTKANSEALAMHIQCLMADYIIVAFNSDQITIEKSKQRVLKLVKQLLVQFN